LKSIYKNRQYNVVNDSGDGLDLEPAAGGHVIFVSFADPELIVDPTDEQWEDAEND
jgi:hypothetical protein